MTAAPGRAAAAALLLAILGGLRPPRAPAFEVEDGAGTVLLAGVTARARFGGGQELVAAEPGTVEQAGLRLHVSLEPGPGRAVLRVRLENAGTGAVLVSGLDPLAGARPLLGPGSGPPLLFADGRSMADAPRVERTGSLSGHGLLALERGGTACAVGAAEGRAELELRWRDGVIDAGYGLGDLEVGPGQSFEGRLQVASGAGLGAAIERWAEAALEGSEPRRARSGWCSWYATHRPDEAWVLAHAGLVKELGLEVLQIDDGWQRRAGEWDANPLYPSGMGAVAQALRAQGLVPGLWVAPFVAAEEAPVVREHPEWVIRDGSGKPARREHRPEWGGSVVALDPSRPEVRDWLRELGRRLGREWGYGYLKLDFLSWGVSPARADRSLTPLEAYRLGLEAFREGAGRDVYLLGADAILAGSRGLLDAVRTGPDASLLGGKQALTLVASARRLHWRRAYALDPDVVMVRPGLSPEEILGRAYFPVLSRGAFFSGDVLNGLGDGGRAVLEAALASWEAAAPAASPGLFPAGASLAAPGPVGAPQPVLWLAEAGLEAAGRVRLGGRDWLHDPVAGVAAPVRRLLPGSVVLLLSADPAAPLAVDPRLPLSPLPITPLEPAPWVRVPPPASGGEVLAWVEPWGQGGCRWATRLRVSPGPAAGAMELFP